MSEAPPNDPTRLERILAAVNDTAAETQRQLGEQTTAVLEAGTAARDDVLAAVRDLSTEITSRLEGMAEQDRVDQADLVSRLDALATAAQSMLTGQQLNHAAVMEALAGLAAGQQTILGKLGQCCPEKPPEHPTDPLDEIFPPGTTLLGAYYTSGSRETDEAFARLVGHPPAIATTYHYVDRPQTIEPNHAWRIEAGILPLISVALIAEQGEQAYDEWIDRTAAASARRPDDREDWRPRGGIDELLQDEQRGTSIAPILWSRVVAREQKVIAWLVAMAQAIGELDAAVLAALDQEPDVRHERGDQPDDPEVYARAADIWAEILAEHAPKAIPVHWVGNPRRDGAAYAAWRWRLFGYDPYHWDHHPADETALETIRHGYIAARELAGDRPVMLCETGSDTNRGDGIAARWWSTGEAAIEALRELDGRGLAAIVFFNSRMWRIDEGTTQSLNAYRQLAGRLARKLRRLVRRTE